MTPDIATMIIPMKTTAATATTNGMLIINYATTVTILHTITVLHSVPLRLGGGGGCVE